MNNGMPNGTAIEILQPVEVAAYLRATGWKLARAIAGKEQFWEKPSPEETPFEIQVPFNHGFRDFHLRMADVLATLAVAEQRPQLEILADLSTTAADVVRIPPSTARKQRRDNTS